MIANPPKQGWLKQKESILTEELFDFLIGLGELVLAELHQGFGTLQLLGELINIQFIILHSFNNLLKLSYSLLVFHFVFCHNFIVFGVNRVNS